MRTTSCALGARSSYCAPGAAAFPAFARKTAGVVALKGHFAGLLSLARKLRLRDPRCRGAEVDGPPSVIAIQGGIAVDLLIAAAGNGGSGPEGKFYNCLICMTN